MDEPTDRECLLGSEDRSFEASDIPSPEPTSSQRAQQKAGLSYPPRLASTIASRESAFEADSDTVSEFDSTRNTPTRGQGLDPSSELRMTGLLEAGQRRGSVMTTGDDRPSYMFSDDIEEPLLPQDRSKIGGPSRQESDDYSHLLDSGTGMMAGVANMANSILGAGIIGLPYALRNAGFLTGTVMVIVLGIVTDWSIRLIALNSKMTGQRSYIGILEQCFGFPGKAAVSFFQFIFAFGGMCAFGVIVGDTIPPVLSTLFPFVPKSQWFSFLFSRSFVITFFTITVSYPLSLYRDIGKLSKASAMALMSMVMIVFSVALGGPSVDPKLKGNPSARWTFIQPGIVEAIGVISFAFVCHHNSLLIYGSLRTPTLDRFAQVTHVSTALSVFACLVMSFSGFLTFTDRTEANILNNFPRDDLVINIARVCFGLNMFTTLPLECFVCRETIDTFFYPDEMFNLRRHVIHTTLLVGIGMLLSLWTCDLGVVLELTGGLAASALAYVFPAACQLKLSSKTGSIFERENWAGLLTVAFGLAVMLISTITSLSKALDPHRVPKVCL
ncbi:hypothetical protein PGT21_012885 [Puccinia graminis f. sp. tritici]|uniref:Amino acid transporter transmembrane domain-containing protein n=1 Tax=Puccinia graminis f. sp. tritici TaxID=56615 RepID=A0A5B0N8I5_PUCGR|nr:hypothetical protein PGT21_012885 [Puccinia graminis f. sp. tritici]KAA1136029.1 hypothetical protein PGTUg99_022592 [Puccinia graminis f. sp. tritici]